LAKTVGVCIAIIIIPIIFYSYTAITGKSMFVIDITTFVVAVIIGQISSYKLLTHRKLSENLNRISLVLIVILGIAFVLFTFYPPQLPIFKDPITEKYGIPK
jgi:protein-S-isoprenylcysteine O-methyltransferase Ste14